MRDLLIVAIILGAIPYIFRKPYIGALMWVWISVMNPHRLTWGFAYSLPLAALIGGVTLVSAVITKEPRHLPLKAPTIFLIAFTLWMGVTSLFALHPEVIGGMWSKVTKIMFMVFVTMLLIQTKEQIHFLIWVLVGSLGFYGIKGGIFSLVGGGIDRVCGPPSTYIEGNNELALALILIIPIMRYVQVTATNKWVRYAMVASMGLSALSALASHSRGALLAIAAMALFLWLKTRNKIVTGIMMAVIGVGLLAFMPEHWFGRMETIQTYEQDESAMGRINAWWMAFNLASDRPLVGGGFEIYEPDVFAKYAPVPEDIHAAHSVYFQVLGEHGFVGLALYLFFGYSSWRSASKIIKLSAGIESCNWAAEFARMIQVGLIGFAVGGAFLSLAYFDVPYYLVASLVLTQVWVERERGKQTAPSAKPQLTSQHGFNRPKYKPQSQPSKPALPRPRSQPWTRPYRPPGSG